jgi:hypothetical protein
MSAVIAITAMAAVFYALDRWDARRVTRDETEDRQLRQLLEGRWR